MSPSVDIDVWDTVGELLDLTERETDELRALCLEIGVKEWQVLALITHLRSMLKAQFLDAS